MPYHEKSLSVEEVLQEVLANIAAIEKTCEALRQALNHQAESLGRCIYIAESVYAKVFLDPKSPLSDPKFLADANKSYRELRELQIANATASPKQVN
jgi:hypothetical protein